MFFRRATVNCTWTWDAFLLPPYNSGSSQNSNLQRLKKKGGLLIGGVKFLDLCLKYLATKKRCSDLLKLFFLPHQSK